MPQWIEAELRGIADDLQAGGGVGRGPPASFRRVGHAPRAHLHTQRVLIPQTKRRKHASSLHRQYCLAVKSHARGEMWRPYDVSGGRSVPRVADAGGGEEVAGWQVRENDAGDVSRERRPR